jgi:hypothetical protein
MKRNEFRNNKIVDRIEKASGVPNLASILAEKLAPTDLQSLLLEVYRRRTSRMTPAEVLANYENDRFVRPASVSPKINNRWEQVVFAQLRSEFELVSLSTVCPLGTSSVLAGIDQNWVVSTVRNTEVVSDLTNVLALECALRRRALLQEQPKSSQPIHLASSHRVLRAQRFDDPGLLSHFSLLGLVSGGRDRGNYSFELSTIGLHARTYIKCLKAFLGIEASLMISVTAFNPSINASMLEEELLRPIEAQFEGLEIRVDPERSIGRGYYQNLSFQIYATDSSGQLLQLADGGDVDWTRKLLSNAKERLIISGLGSERVCALWLQS